MRIIEGVWGRGARAKVSILSIPCVCVCVCVRVHVYHAAMTGSKHLAMCVCVPYEIVFKRHLPYATLICYRSEGSAVDEFYNHGSI